MRCAVVGGLDKPRLKVVCRVTVVKPSARVRWRVARRDDGSLVDRGRDALRDRRLVINLTRVDEVRKGRHRVTVTKGKGVNKIVLRRIVRIR